MASRQAKREEFLSGEARYRGPNRVALLLVAVIAAVGVGWFALVTRDTEAVPRRWEGGTYNIGRSMDYKGQTISMTDIANRQVGGEVRVSLDDVVKNKIVYTDIDHQRVDAMTAFISPAGRLVVAVAMCEPCRSQRFHIQDNILVCDTCGTRWFLNDLRGISGGCPQYPPEEIPYEVVDGDIVFRTGILDQWAPRTTQGEADMID